MPRRRPFPLALAVVLALGAPASAAAQGAIHADEVVDVRALLLRAEQGDTRAAFLLGTRYASGRGGARDDSEAARWFRRAAEGGLAEAQYNLGVMYASGRGVPRDAALAARWYRAAAEQGIARAQFNLGAMYAGGVGVPRDDALAAEWFHRAADAGLAQAQYNLGVLYEHGQGVRLDGRAALVWYSRAAEQGYEPARERLDALMAKLRLDEVPAAARLARAGGTAPEEARAEARAPLDWVARGDPGSYTLQILSDTNEESVRRFVGRHFGPGDLAGYFASVKKGVTWYSVVYGEYPTYEEAEAAVPDLPPALRRGEPWVRKIRLIQEQMLR